MCGLKLNKEKSKLEPMQVGQWSGFVTDKIGMQFGVPSMKIAQLKSDLDFFISSRTVTFRDLAWVSGFINSLFVAVDLIASRSHRQSVEKLFPIISYDYLSQPNPSLGQREPAFSPCNHAQYCPSTADRVVIFVFKQGYTLGKISSLFKKDLEMIILCNNSHGGIIRVCKGIFTTALKE